ncbi:hypothetical protein QQ020_33915 [Fulvivirgaceae bacterium BMA12]|uniref:Hydratase/decarboxylase n=1 Tax=Agaribacillus aureus TaxID=3051825 RepID=A0ABT8LHW1_9BACT|nr:hypothetical protein [Fulvivirgaceae bacterium BMA12]
MNRLYTLALAFLIITACKHKSDTSSSETAPPAVVDETEIAVDSLLYFRHHYQQTDMLSRRFPGITLEKSMEIQLRMLEKELKAGARHIGWKMGGTVTDDSASYNPLFGYILDKNVIQQDSAVLAENFPSAQVEVEGEIGFVMKKDFQNGAKSLEELKAGIDYVVNAVEFAKAVAIPLNGNAETMTINHVMASGLGHAGIIIGAGRADIEEFDMENETVKCFIDGELAAEGTATNVYGTPLNALYSLVNMLPEQGIYLKKGDIIITGSLYKNPVIDSTCAVKLAFSSLGDISFSME